MRQGNGVNSMGTDSSDGRERRLQKERGTHAQKRKKEKLRGGHGSLI